MVVSHEQSAVWVREWALERWAEGTQVALAEELPTLKAQIRAAKAAAAVHAGEEES